MGPDLIYLPEIPFDCETFFADVEKIYKATGKCIVAISEGIAAADGKLMVEKFAEGTDVARDSFGHAQLFGIAAGNLVDCGLGILAVLLQGALNAAGISPQWQCGMLAVLSAAVAAFIIRNVRAY
ncbi:MAG: hypothetical protein IJ956_07675, partial [Akkermansia sp.]|nr:hypothetical protein [Akkermansia sp.]